MQRDDAPYFLKNRPDEPHATLADARVAAGMIQCEQAQRGHMPLSIQILQRGEVVDLKRV